jgi:hypothetical protein
MLRFEMRWQRSLTDKWMSKKKGDPVQLRKSAGCLCKKKHQHGKRNADDLQTNETAAWTLCNGTSFVGSCESTLGRRWILNSHPNFPLIPKLSRALLTAGNVIWSARVYLPFLSFRKMTALLSSSSPPLLKHRVLVQLQAIDAYENHPNRVACNCKQPTQTIINLCTWKQTTHIMSLLLWLHISSKKSCGSQLVAPTSCPVLCTLSHAYHPS